MGIETHYRQGLLDKTFYEKRLAGFTFNLPENLPEARSLIVVAVGDPQVRFTCTWNERRIPLIVPPTFLHWREADKQVEDTLAEVLSSEGYRVARAALPKKLLAVHSGLAAYGRNNITYVAGMGSFHRLAAFYSNLSCEQDNWQELRMMERCQTCFACLRNCPTGAISAERFLLHAERCITFHNEDPGEVPFPEWLDLSWHNCLVGCLHCQRVCPENKDFLTWVEEGAEFSSEETMLLLEGVPLNQLPAATVKKLERWDMVDLVDILPRNLRVLFKRMEI
ncbi:MAG: 4Fe-4S double cluster binding domain-containing protein [Chloroflexota bacterium]|nr:4Fe-4S double cluster binding domain-containing protein [Chloroflexota bacterium]